MSSFYIMEETINLEGPDLLVDYPNKLVQPTSLSFPSTIINCSLTIKKAIFVRTDTQANASPGAISWIGSGIDDISYINNEAFFTPWMQLAYFTKWTESTANQASLPPNGVCRITVLAIAECHSYYQSKYF